MVALELNKVTKRYGDVYAVKNISLSVKTHEMFFLLGPSGCGKTTTLRMIAGLELPNSGTLKIQGEDVTRTPPNKRNIAIVFQRWALFPHKNVYDNIAFGLKMKKQPKDEIANKVKKILETIGLPEFENRYPRELSGGQQQRIALARSLVVEPNILLLDEPLSNLDLNMRVKMRMEIINLHRQFKLTTIFVTHDQTEALAMADRIALMGDGKIVEVGKPHDIYKSPRSNFTANFIGNKNYIDGMVFSTNKSHAVIKSDKGLYVEVPSPRENPLQKNSKISIYINSEQVTLSRGCDSQTNCYKGVIKNVMYLGSINKYQIDLECGETIMCDIQSSGITEYRCGEIINLILEPRYCICIPKAN